MLEIAERLSARHTPGGGHCFLDVLPAATAFHLGTAEFLSCDANRQILGAAEILTVKP